MAEPFTKALDMLEAEKSAILGKKLSLSFLSSPYLLGAPQATLCHLLLT